MTKSAKRTTWKIAQSGVKYAWYGRDDLYGGIASDCGAEKAGNSEKQLVFGANNKTVRLRFNLENGKSTLRRVRPDKVSSLLDGGANGKSLAGSKVNSVTPMGR